MFLGIIQPNRKQTQPMIIIINQLSPFIGAPDGT